MPGTESTTINARPSDLDHLRWLENYTTVDWKGRSVLDLGCGSGFVCQQALAWGASKAVGVDIIVPERDEPAAADSSLLFLDIDLDDPVWTRAMKAREASHFDILMAFDIIEHLCSPWLFLQQCMAVLAHDGVLLLTTPNTNSWERLLRPRSWSGFNDPQHKTLFNRYSLRFMLEKAGFSIDFVVAPVRRLGRAAKHLPQIGGQLFVAARKV